MILPFSRALIVTGMLAAIISQTIYNLLPAGVGDKLEMLAFLPALLLAAFFPLILRNRLPDYLAVYCCLIILLILISRTDFSLNFNAFSRFILMISSLFLLLLSPFVQLKTRDLQVIVNVTLVMAAVAMAQAFLLDPIHVGGKDRLAVVSGGSDGLHPSAYSTLALLLVLWMLPSPEGRFMRLFHGAMCCLLFVAVMLYGVRTAQLLLLLLLALRFLERRRPDTAPLVPPLLLIYGLLALVSLIALMTVLDTHSLGNFSSGRTIVYLERLDLIAGRDLMEFLFGTGAGSDMFRGEGAWSWVEKDSHNDILTTTIEIGLLGLAAIVTALACVSANLKRNVLPLFIAFLSTSLISNGLLLRPSSNTIYIYLMVIMNMPRFKEFSAHSRIEASV